MKSEMLNNQIKRYDWVIEGILCILCSNLACLLFFLQQSLYIHVYTIHMYFFQEFSEEGRWGNFSIKINTEYS